MKRWPPDALKWWDDFIEVVLDAWDSGDEDFRRRQLAELRLAHGDHVPTGTEVDEFLRRLEVAR